MLKKDSNGGFTLIELVVVMAIIAVLALLIIAAIQAARSQSIRTQNSGNARTVETALESYAAKKGGVYCGATGDATVCSVAGAAQNISTVWANLQTDELLSSTINTACSANGGGTIVLTATSFTITVKDSNCTTDTTPTITH